MTDFIPNQPSEAVVGLPPAGELTDMSGIFQSYSDTCAIRSQEIILRDFGIDLPQEQLIEESASHGWYNHNGTQMNDVGNLLELHGVGIEKYQNASVEDLIKNLAEGKRIIVGVDSGELWDEGFFEDLQDEIFGNQPDHALIVAGIDMSDPMNPQVVLTDPGTGHVAKNYPLDQFMDAWQDSGNYMVVTDQPAPSTASGMANFDYNSNHIPYIGDMSYNDWLNQNKDSFSNPIYHSFDIDSDGVIDARLADQNGNGIMETSLIDVDGDGNIDMALVDIDEDGQVDAIHRDIDGDGQEDLIEMDMDGDGQMDSALVDTDGDGQMDLALVDTDGDGQLDSELVDMDDDGVIDSIASLTDDSL